MIWFFAYLGTIVTANWSLATFGLIPVGFGLMAPAGVMFAGLAFTFRDLLQEAQGKPAVLLGIAAGGLLSLLIEPRFALASATAFALSELVDFAIYTPLRRRSFLGAVALSNTVGLVLDSVIFLLLAFGSLEFLAGQIVGKMYATLLAVWLLWLRRRQVALA